MGSSFSIYTTITKWRVLKIMYEFMVAQIIIINFCAFGLSQFNILFREGHITFF